jgi:hypothetical protein
MPCTNVTASCAREIIAVEKNTVVNFFTIMLHAFAGWALSGAVLGVSLELTSPPFALVIHALCVPVIFGVISLYYFMNFASATPLQTSILFVSFVVFMDFFVIGFFFKPVFAMMATLMGLWIPLVLIFISTFLIGVFIRNQSRLH